MANQKLSELNEVTALSDSDEFYVNASGVSKRFTKASLNGDIEITLDQVSDVTASALEVNLLDGFTGDHTDLNYARDLHDTGVTTTEFNKLDGLTPNTTELNYVDGVTSSIQTQLGGKLGSTATAVSATKLASVRSISLTGEVTGSGEFDGTGPCDIHAYVTDNSHNHTVSNLSDTSVTAAELNTLHGLVGNQSSTGYQELPSGLLLQWGYAYSSTDSAQTFTFPTAFGQTCYGVFTNRASSSAKNILPVTSLSSTTFVVSRNSDVSDSYFHWFAIGTTVMAA